MTSSNSTPRAPLGGPRAHRVGASLGVALAIGLVPIVGFGQDGTLAALAEQLIQLRGEVEALNDDIESRQQDHRNRMSSLSQRRAELEAQIQRQELDIKKLQRTIDELNAKSEAVAQESASLRPVAEQSITRLESRVKAGLPFTVDERLAELGGVRTKLEKGEISAPRALNQLWTFVEDELRLSRENGLFRQTIVLDDEEQLADVVRLGMTMLFFHTGDGEYGHATRNGDGWTYVTVGDEQAQHVEALFEDFEKQVRTGFFTVPNALVGGAR
jgi:hypothetical protein